MPTSDGPFIVKEEIGLPGDRRYWLCSDPLSGICIGGTHTREASEDYQHALNAAYCLGRDQANLMDAKDIRVWAWLRGDQARGIFLSHGGEGGKFYARLDGGGEDDESVLSDGVGETPGQAISEAARLLPEN